ncbi:TetR/AcrR family transcriptional regulator [Nakamurella aerolata]|uniref:TetR/AcrR family transcriptional regulator n=1 Tax=Nakamurella aerolata TaxID=1656892 RepID=A0A849A376_9ACTN|nr:TetR/AcrR family transcriptional regulator [Nakamurella aerolata]NNG35015.1 TetR/AcrR family transcriptional regulator [Nakamurella aerolata]
MRPGRPPKFDRDTAILEAARLFWRHGYAGTSTRALSGSLGMSTSSIYAAFGSKAGLFELAVRTYAERYRTIYRQALAEPDFAVALAELFRRSVEEFTQPSSGHPGCLVSSAALTDKPDTIDIRAYLEDLYSDNKRLLRTRIERAQRDGQLPVSIEPAALALSLQAVWHGLSAQSNFGHPRADLQQAADILISGLLTRQGSTGVKKSLAEAQQHL